MSETETTTIAGNKNGDIVDTTTGGTGKEARVRKSLTPSSLVGKITQEMIPEKGAPTTWLLEIFGQVEGFETGQTQFGPFIRLKGEFIADNLLTGEQTDGPTAILPALAEMVVRNQLRAVGFGTPNGPKAVTFAMRVGIDWNKPDEQIIDGKAVMLKKYTWAIAPIGAQAKTPLRLIKEQMQEAMRLNAPSPQAALEAPVAAAPHKAAAKK
jgi:hypothetical protein